MYFYPRTLKSTWYIADVCNCIHSSLEGAKKWGSYYYQSKIERDAFVETFEECQSLVKKNDLQPQAMLRALSDLHDTLPMMSKPSIFSRARWFHKPLEAREKAILVAFELVDGISNRYL